MIKQLIKRIGSLVMAMLILVNCFSGTALAQEDNVKPSKENYVVELKNSGNFFLCNKKSIGTTPGTVYYMTYTVKSSSLDSKTTSQQGVAGVINPAQNYPYAVDGDGNGGGLMYYDGGIANKLFLEGRTYFLRFEITEEGYDYEVAWAEGDTSRYIKFNTVYNERNKELGYFGIWNTTAVTGTLIKVRCYDKDGNDLGVQIFDQGQTAVAGTEKGHKANTAVDHWYTVECDSYIYGAISNKRETTSNTIYMEYTVKKGSMQCRHEGVMLSANPLERYPYNVDSDDTYEGFILFNQYNDKSKGYTGDFEDSKLFVEGASYFITFEKLESRLKVTVQRTYKGKVDYLAFDQALGTYSKDHPNAFIWFENGEAEPRELVLENFRCYDAQNNNLALQCNNSAVKFTHHGELEDYAGCEAIYRCNEDESFYAFYPDQTLKFTENGKTVNGRYSISQDVLSMTIGGKKSSCDYLYQHFTTADGRRYERLYTYQVTFDSNGGSEVETQILNAENGFKPMRPENPTLEGNTFSGWYMIDGKEYKFEDICLESITLYAKWEKTEYKKVVEDDVKVEKGPIGWGYIAGGAVILVASVATGIIIIVKSKKRGSES